MPMAVRELEVTVNEAGAAATIALSGEINSAAEQQLDAAYERASAAGVRTIVLDFAAAEYINSSGIALIVGLLGQARGRGIEVQARGLSEHYREIFEITRLADFMTILDNEHSAADGAEGKEHA
jgi:anti-anti-sigma factor